MTSRNLRTRQLLQAIESRILVLDGAMGTAIQSLSLSADDFGGQDFEGCNDFLSVTRPDLIGSIHEEYLKAGCDIIESNTFGATPLVLDEYGLGARTPEINLSAARIAQEVAARHSTPERPRFVAGSMGPTTKAISVTGGVSFETLIENFRAQATALVKGGVDYLLLETCQDTRNIKAALAGIDRAFDTLGEQAPIAVSVTIEPTGAMLAGQSVEALLASLSHRNLLYIGLNCATGPEFMTDHIRSLARLSRFPIACVPNAGLPDENGCYLENPEMVAAVLERFAASGWLNIIGGCCGTHVEHIRALTQLAATYRPRSATLRRVSGVSGLAGIDYLEITDEMRPIIVGERTNSIGSKKFRDLICEAKFDEAAEIARSQVKTGAQVIDICLSNPDRNELEDMRLFLDKAVRKIRVPIMIDSTDEKVIALALTYCQGKSIINSINLEDGEERYARVIPLARQFGAAFVVGTIDDDPVQGMGITRERKLAIAERSYQLLTEKYGVAAEDIYWDPLVFPCATGDAQYIGSAVETIEAIRLIKQRFPGTRTILGISNVSFGLPPAGREVLNSVFLYHCVQAGLDLAIVNSEKLQRYASISEEEKRLADDLLFMREASSDPTGAVGAFVAHFRQKKTVVSDKAKLPLLERLSRHIIEGSKDGLADNLNEALQTMKPLEIINGPLMAAMDEVGRLFNANQLIVAEVLQSAEAMKAAVAHLESSMDKREASLRGKVVLATVKGDVHDIGKNLVEIILSNNGFEVVNLGIKISPEALIQAVREHKPALVGLSGLLVKSAQQMAITAADFTKAGLDVPMLLGGAALSSGFVDRQVVPVYQGTVAYASDAMNGLELAKQIVDPARFEKLRNELATKRALPAAAAKTAPVPASSAVQASSRMTQDRSSAIKVLDSPPNPPDFERHVLRSTPIAQIWNYVNPLMLYCRHLGINGGIVRLLEKAADDPLARKQLERTQAKALEIWDAVREVKEKYRGTEIMQSSAIFQFFRAASDGNRLHVFKPGDSGAVAFGFPRQPQANGLCLSDYIAPSSASLPRDNIAMFVVTVGKGIRQLAESLKSRGDYLRSHIVQALALESAEAYSELLHAEIRKAWGFPDPPEMTMLERFQAKYRGRRYSFGYPACPVLDDQTLLWELLKPDDIGVQLTDGFMMDPEASVSAIVFHHPQATYFSAGTSSA